MKVDFFIGDPIFVHDHTNSSWGIVHDHILIAHGLIMHDPMNSNDLFCSLKTKVQAYKHAFMQLFMVVPGKQWLEKLPIL